MKTIPSKFAEEHFALLIVPCPFSTNRKRGKEGGKSARLTPFARHAFSSYFQPCPSVFMQCGTRPEARAGFLPPSICRCRAAHGSHLFRVSRTASQQLCPKTAAFGGIRKRHASSRRRLRASPRRKDGRSAWRCGTCLALLERKRHGGKYRHDA